VDFAAALYTFLTTNSGIVAQVSTRTYPVQLPQGVTLPALVFREMYTDTNYALQADDTLIRPTYEIEAHASSHAAARTAIRAVETALQNYSGTMTTCTVQAVLMAGGSEDYDPDTTNYWRSKEFTFFVQEA
jgi:hypothetical protein